MNEHETHAEIIEKLREEIPQKMKKQNIPGLAVAMVSKNETLWCEGFGYTDMSHTQAVNTDTLFSLQSTTKAVTTVAFLLAVQKGLGSLDDPLVTVYPEFTVNSRFGKDEYKRITFRHLLSHTSGLVREGRLGGVFNYDPCTFEEHIQSISDSWLKFPVGKGISYSNAGMDIVAYALGRMSGMPYPDYVQKVLGDPLGITFHYDTKEVTENKNAARGYLGETRALPVEPSGFGCGIAHLSIKDQAAFVRFLVNLGMVNGSQVLAQEYINAMRSTDKEGWYGLGTFVNNVNDIALPHHQGGGFGLRSEMYWVPEYNIGVAVFTNQEEPIEDNYISILAEKALKSILKAQGASLEQKFPHKDTVKVIDNRLLERLTGLYSGSWGSVSVVFGDGKVYLDYPGKKIELTPHSDTVFSAESRGVTFQLKEGAPVSLKMYYPDKMLHMDYRGRPPEGPGPNRKEWKEVEGLYQMVIYGTLPVHSAVKVEGDGFLHMRWDISTCLYPHETVPNVFFTFSGEPVVFVEGGLYYDNTKCEKIDDPMAFMRGLLKKDPEYFGVQEWMIDDVVGNLRYLGRNEEAEKIGQLSKNDGSQ